MTSRAQGDSSQDHVIEADCPKCGKEIFIDIDRFKNPGYVNWVKCSLCLQHMKEGIEVVCDELADSLKGYVKEEIQNTTKCDTCKELKDIENCKNTYCQHLKSKLCGVSFTGTLTFRNASPTELQDISGWDLAVLFMPALPKRPQNASDSDSTALLSLLFTCLKNQSVIDNAKHVKEARHSRNNILHSSTMKLQHHELTQYAESFLDVLKDPKRMNDEPACKKARQKINKLLNDEHDLQMKLVQKTESEVLKDHFSAVEDRVHQLSTDLETCTDRQTISNIEKELKHINQNHLKTTITMELYKMESTKPEETSKKISELIVKTEKTHIDIAVNEENSKIIQSYTKTIAELQQRLEKETQTTDDLRQRLEEKTKTLEDLIQRLEEQTKLTSSDYQRKTVGVDEKEIDKETPEEQQTAKIRVSNIPEQVNQENLKMFFEDTKQFDVFLQIVDIDFDEEEHVAIIEFEDPQDVQVVLEKQPLSMSGRVLNIVEYVPELVKDYAEETPEEQQTAKIRVSNIPEKVNQENLKMFFEDTKQFDVFLQIVNIEFDEEEHVAIIEFEDPQDVQVALEKQPLSMSGRVLNIEEYVPELVKDYAEETPEEQQTAKIRVSNIPEKVNQENLKMFFEDTKQFDVFLQIVDIDFDEEEHVAIIEFEYPQDVQVVLEKQPLSMSGRVLNIEEYVPELVKDYAEETPEEQQTAKIRVSNIPEKVNQENLKMFFEDTKQFDVFLQIVDIDFDEEEHVAIIEFEDPQDVQVVLEKQPLSMSGRVLNIEEYVPELVKDYAEDLLGGEGETVKILVNNIPSKAFDEKTLEKFFEKLCGGDVENIKILGEYEAAVIEFKESKAVELIMERQPISIYETELEVREYNPKLETIEEVRGEFSEAEKDILENYFENRMESAAKAVSERDSHQVDGGDLAVSQYIPPPPRPIYNNKLLIKGLKSSTSKDCLFSFLEAKSERNIPTQEQHGEKEGVRLVTFERPIEFDKLQQSVKTLEGADLQIEIVTMSKCISVFNYDEAFGKDTLELYFENSASSGGGQVEKVSFNDEEGYWLVCFADYNVESPDDDLRDDDDYYDDDEDNDDEQEEEEDQYFPRISGSQWPILSPCMRMHAFCRTSDNRKIFIAQGDMTEMSLDILVNTSDRKMNLAEELGKAISSKGGQQIQDACSSYISQYGALEEGDCFLSPGGNLKAKAVIHVAGPTWQNGEHNEKDRLKEAVSNVMKQASIQNHKSIALPAISCGTFGYPSKVAASVIVQAIQNFFREEQDSPIKLVYLCDVELETIEAFTDSLKTCFDREVKVLPTESLQRMIPGTKVVIGNITVTVVKGELAKEKVNALVNTTHDNLDLSIGAVSKSLLTAAGAEIQIEVTAIHPEKLQPGEIVITQGYNLNCDIVLHTTLPHYNGEVAIQILQDVMDKCMTEASKRNYTKIAFPAIGTGYLKFPKEEVATEMFTAIETFMKKDPNTSLTDVKFVVYHKDTDTIKTFEQEEMRWMSGSRVVQQVTEQSEF